MISDNLHVWEIAYLDKDTLMHLLSFLRMYEGELKTIRFHNIGMTPDVACTFRVEYENGKCEVKRLDTDWVCLVFHWSVN